LAVPVAEVAEQLQRPGQAGGGGPEVPGQLTTTPTWLRAWARPCWSSRSRNSCKASVRLAVAAEWSPVSCCATPSWFRAQAWPCPAAEVAEHAQRPGQVAGGGRVVPGQPLHHAQIAEGPGLAVAVADVAEQPHALASALCVVIFVHLRPRTT
jgi:hypothetical protein